MDQKSAGICQYNPVHVINTGIPPHTTVESEQHENRNTEDRIPRGEAHPGRHIPFHSHCSQFAAHKETDQESEVVAGIHCHKIQNHNPQVLRNRVQYFLQNIVTFSTVMKGYGASPRINRELSTFLGFAISRTVRLLAPPFSAHLPVTIHFP